MSELIDMGRNQQTVRGCLLTTVSILALLPWIWRANEAKAESNDTDRPTIWIELGGQLERQTAQGGVYDPPFVANDPSSPAYKPASPLQSEKPPLFSNGGEAKLSFAPDGSDWVFSAGVRYGRANGSKSTINKSAGQIATDVIQYRVYPTPNTYYYHCCEKFPVQGPGPDFASTTINHHDSHAILDFQAGKEVGLGLFGQDSDSLVSAGIRFAQFTAKSNVVLHARPDLNHYNGANAYIRSHHPSWYFAAFRFHSFEGTAQSARSFQGLGPSISWDSSIALLGNAQAGELSFDWGANAAVLFGHHRAVGRHHETAVYKHRTAGVMQLYSQTASFDRTRSVVVPDFGGFAGASFKFPNAKISLGYRADLFFGAMDTGIDAQRTPVTGFYGPFASISFGFGG